MYGDEDDSGSEGGRPLSFVGGSPYQEQIQPVQHYDDHLTPEPRKPLTRSLSDQPSNTSISTNGDHSPVKKSHTLPLRIPSQRSNSYDHGPKSPLSPTPSLRDVQADSSGSQFPLTNIDNPNDIAQELSNLQALRRLSMDVANNKDPDMPPMSLMAMPAIAPTGDDDENDPSRLLWVPARVHPELAPTEFKSFLENRVHSIRRRSGDSFLSADGDLSPGDSVSGSLRRKKSMLSRQIDNSSGRGAVGYVDGADRLDRKRSSSGSQNSPELSIEDLVKDPSSVVQKLTQDTTQGQPTGPESNVDDMPILPMAPGMGLRRSTRTTYRKGGSLRSGERIPFSKRIAQRQQDADTAEAIPSPIEAPKGHTLARVQSEPVGDNFSRPNRSVRRQNKFSQESPATLATLEGFSEGSLNEGSSDTRPYSPPETAQDSAHSTMEPTTPEQSQDVVEDQYGRPFPKRSSSQSAASQMVAQATTEIEPIAEEPIIQSQISPNRPALNQTPPPQHQYTSKSPPPQHGQSLSDSLSANSSTYTGSGSTRPDTLTTDTLTFIPTFSQEEKKPEKKSKKEKDEDTASTTSSKSSGWKWFKSGSDKEEKKKDESKKSKTRSLVEKAQDNVRLDVIQTSIDKTAIKGRESVVLDRDNVDSRLQEERKKESHRKSDSKKEKDGSIFSSIFGGSKKKEEKERNAKKAQHLKVPEEPVYKPLQPDVDYHWTRFPLLEERAIYRMAHIKLANPRRSLLSQVLLSNFMYSYLAIVQAMHPQMNVPISPQQKRLEEEARRKQQEEEYLAQQQMQDDQDSEALDQYNFEYHRVS